MGVWVLSSSARCSLSPPPLCPSPYADPYGTQAANELGLPPGEHLAYERKDAWDMKVCSGAPRRFERGLHVPLVL